MKLSNKILNAATTAAGVLIGIPTWPQKLDGDEQAGELKEIRKALENRLQEMAFLLEQLPREQQPSAQDTVLEKLRSSLPVSVVKTIDGYRELKMACADIAGAAA